MDEQRPAEATRTPHHRGRWWALWAVVGVILALVIGWGVLFWVAEPPEPGGFYRPPDPLPAGEPGTILRTARLADTPHGSKGTRILYLSTDHDGDPIAVSGVVVVPEGDPPEGGWPVVAWSHPTTGVVPRCGPSISPSVVSTIAGADELLAAGYAIAATDYPGLGTPGPHPYLIGESEARSTIDSVRALRALHPDAVSDRYVAWGHSQGGQSVLFVGQIAEDYAPDLELLGVAAAAPATELTALLEADIHTLAGKVLGSFGLVSWSQLSPDMALDRIVEPEGIASVEGIGKVCVGTDLEKAVLGPDALVLQGLDSLNVWLKHDPTTTEPWKSLLEKNSATPGDVRVPLVIAQGTEDEVVRPDITRRFVDESCDAGATVRLDVLEGVDHAMAAFDSVDQIVPWIEARFAGEDAPSSCDGDG